MKIYTISTSLEIDLPSAISYSIDDKNRLMLFKDANGETVGVVALVQLVAVIVYHLDPQE